jgi:anti-sigma factor RsiW
LKAEGCPLAGGRLDYLHDRLVAALVYYRREHIINLLVWPTPAAPDEIPGSQTRRGYHVFHWTEAGLTYWVISDLNEAELHKFVELSRR